MGQVMMLSRGRQQADGIPRFTYTGTSQVVDEGEKNWQIKFLTSGIFVIQSYGDFSVDAFLVGGGGAGSRQGGAGGGGYHSMPRNVILLRKEQYPITIGVGGMGTGAAGGTTTAFGNSVLGGGGGVAGSVTGVVCTVHGTTGTAGNVYYYSSLSASAVSIGDHYRAVRLAYPIQSAYHNNGTYVVRCADGGYYRCTIVSEDSYITSNGSNGAGGTATQGFGGSNPVWYCGAGSAPGGVSGGANTGKGGDGSNHYNGTTFGFGGSGIIIIRNKR